MTTKTGEKLRGRKRDPSVLRKAWATRRANKRKAKRAAARTGSSKRSAPLVSSSGTIHGYQRTPAAASTIPATKRIGSTTRGRKAAKAPTSPKQTGRRSNRSAGLAAIKSLGQIAETLAVQAESPMRGAHMDGLGWVDNRTAAGIASGDTSGRIEIANGPNPNYRPTSVFDKIEVTARALAVEARKRGGDLVVEKRLRDLMGRAHSDGIEHARLEDMKISDMTFEAARDKIVCSALGVLELEMKLKGGLPPTVVMSSYTICRMMDALNCAGYTSNGRTKT